MSLTWRATGEEDIAGGLEGRVQNKIANLISQFGWPSILCSGTSLIRTPLGQ